MVPVYLVRMVDGKLATMIDPEREPPAVVLAGIIARFGAAAVASVTLRGAGEIWVFGERCCCGTCAACDRRHKKRTAMALQLRNREA